MQVLLAILLCCVVADVMTKELIPVVPVFAWTGVSTERTEVDRGIPNVPALQRLTVGDLHDKLDSRFLSDKIILFINDALSPEDFITNSFTNVRNQAKIGNQAYFPFVEHGIHLQDMLEDRGYTVKHMDHSAANKEFDSGSSKTLYVMNLYSEDGVNRASSLKRNDDIIGQIVKRAGKDFTAILTGRQAAFLSDEESHQRVSRSILSTTPTNVANGTFYNVSGCVFLYLTEQPCLTFTVNKALSIIQLPEPDPENIVANCPNGTEVTINYEDVTQPGVDLDDVSLKINFMVLKDGSWNVSSAVLKLVGTVNGTDIPSTTLRLDMSAVRAPRSNSYHCSDTGLFGPAANVSSNGIGGIQFKGLQIQPATMGKDSFGRVYDCTGFFSVPILAGIMLSLIAAGILAWALTMVMSIKTMDRFDDPKGKPIHVPTVD